MEHGEEEKREGPDSSRAWQTGRLGSQEKTFRETTQGDSAEGHQYTMGQGNTEKVDPYRNCVVYALFNDVQPVFYIGTTSHIGTRLSQHRNRFGQKTGMRILQDVFDGEPPLSAEQKWIAHFLARGVWLRNTRHAKSIAANPNSTDDASDLFSSLGKKGGKARMGGLDAEKRSELGKKAAKARWSKAAKKPATKKVIKGRT
jgi:hypothetical protein